MRLAGKIAVVIGAGQSPGEGIGNGRATVLRFVQEGARVLAVDRDLAAAEATAALTVKEGGECVAFQADVTREVTLAAAMAAAVERWDRLDILHNNVGVSVGGGDKPIEELTEEAFDRVSAINLRGTIMACKHALPIMRRQRSGAIVNISSVAAFENTYPLVTYKVTKAGMVAFTQQLALQNAAYGIRANCILPGLMDTPMAVDTRARASNRSRAEIAAERDAKVPLRGKMGPAGMSRTRHCFSLRTKPISSPAWRCRSMAAPWSRSADGAPSARTRRSRARRHAGSFPISGHRAAC
jgi:NAD(P)-dependent dehydrogenase (short-subunit alcohol dehydrogenase family)